MPTDARDDQTPTASCPKDAFCILPWMHLYVAPSGEILPCCIADWRKPMGNIRSSSVHDVWNGSEFRELRQRMLDGEWSANCSACQEDERESGRSMRLAVNEQFTEDMALVSGARASPDWGFLDVRFSNICNFKCRTCNAGYSSAWEEEDRLFHDGAAPLDGPLHNSPKKGDEADAFVSQIEARLPSVNAVNFAGGEPLIMREHYRLLEALIACGNTGVLLRYSTNASVLKFKDKEIHQLWSHFPKISIVASADAVGARGEYIRSGLDWAQFSRNILEIRRRSAHVEIRFGVVVSLFNVCVLDELFEALADLGAPISNAASPISLYVLKDPPEFAISVLDKETRREAAGRMRAWLDRSEDVGAALRSDCRAIIDRLSAKSDAPPGRARDLIERIDSRRGESLPETFPELCRFYEAAGRIGGGAS